MKFAVFLRNVNLGHPNSPGRAQFEAAFVDAGAARAWSFQTNGTLVFEASSLEQAHAIHQAAQLGLQRVCGLREPMFVRTLSYLQALVDSAPFASVDPAAVYGCFVSFLHTPEPAPPQPPTRRADGGVELIVTTPAELLSVSRIVGRQAGSPNAFFERLMRAPLTTRSWGTVTRLVARHATPP